MKEICKEIKNLDVKIQKRNIFLKELLNYVSQDSIPIVLVNWYLIRGKKGFSGHFIAITGYDKENIYSHNSSIADAMPYFPIKRKTFLKAGESKGTDKDTVVIYRKNYSLI